VITERKLSPRFVICDFCPVWYPNLPLLLPRSVTVAQVTLDHFVMVRIHARQVVDNQRLTSFTENAGIDILAIFSNFAQVEVKLVYDFGS
jgi:hypothetical protein